MARTTTDTEGRRALSAFLIDKGHSQSRLGAVLGVSHVAVGNWLDGTARPDAEKREQIRQLAGIDPELWTTEEELAERKAARERIAAYQRGDVAPTGTEG